MFAVMGIALRLARRHWPAIISLLLLGFAVRDGILWLAIWASRYHAAAGMVVFALVPLSLLTAMLLTLRLVRQSLPGAAGAEFPRRAGARGQLAGTMLPFLAVYASYGFLGEDQGLYVYRIALQDMRETVFAESNAAARLPFVLNMTLIVVVVAAVFLRWLLGINSKIKSFRLIGLVQVYLEVIWLTLAIYVLSGLISPAVDWVARRQAMVWAGSAIDAFISALGPLAAAGRFVKELAGELFVSLDSIVVVPLAWLAVGAIVYDRKLTVADGDDAVTGQLKHRWNLLPTVLRRIASPLRSDLHDSLSPLIRGLRVIGRTGLRPMLMFCLAFVAAATVPAWLNELERLLIGPQDISRVWFAATVPLSAINDAVGIMVMICLVAAAVDFALRAGQNLADGQPGVARVSVPPLSPDSDGLGTGRQHEVAHSLEGP